VLRPAAGVMIDAHDLQHVVVYSVGYDEGRFGDDEFARARHASRVTELRIVCKQLFDAMDDMQGNALGCGWIIHGDVGPQGSQVVDCFGRPRERHTPLGDWRSLRDSHEVTHSLTRWWGMPLPRSSEAMAPRMPATCHSLMSRYSSMAAAARKVRLRPVLLASCCNLALIERARRTETVSVFIGV
jgi:hypothetical protein